VDVVYRMREQPEQLALAESIPNLSAADVRSLEAVQERIEVSDDVATFLELDREFHLRSYTGCRIDQLTSSVTRLWNSTAHYRRTFVTLSGPGRRWVINAEHRLLLDAVARKDVVDAERFVAGHIRRTRIELGRHPEIFEEGHR
jgi:DNA-binding GntR family transcriptional regulator